MELKVDVRKFYSRLNEFRLDKEYCDVTLQIDQKVFRCHKVVLASASEYFHNMFRGNFEESKKDNILLNNIDGVAFEQILDLMYTGRLTVTVTDENSYELLATSEYLGLQYLEDMCLAFFANNIPVRNTIKLFMFAFNTGKKSLLEVLQRHIAENFIIFCQKEEFLDIPNDALKTIFNCAALNLEKEDVLLHAILRWIQHSYDERKTFLPELIEVISFEKVSPAFMKMLTKCMIESSAPMAKELEEKCNNSDLLPCVPDGEILPNVTPLNVYVLSESHSSQLLQSYSIDRNYQWHAVDEIKFPDEVCPKGMILNCKNVGIGEKLHTFYCRAHNGDHKLFHYSCQHTDFHKGEDIKLASPPLKTSSKFNACHAQSKIFFYCNTANVLSFPVLQNFTIDELTRGIYTYYLELDRWFPVREQLIKLDGSHLVSCNDVIYLLGGYLDADDTSFKHGSYVQSYDCRTSAWSRLPDMCSSYRDASACVHNEKIYISGGTYSAQVVEVFDPRAGKWDYVAPMNHPRISHKLVSHKNYLWAIGNTTDLSVEVYDWKVNKWLNLTAMDALVNRQVGGPSHNKVLDAVVFKYIKAVRPGCKRKLSLPDEDSDAGPSEYSSEESP